MPIDMEAVGKVLGIDQDPLLTQNEIDPKSGLLSAEEAEAIKSRLKYGSPTEVYPGYVDKPTLRVLDEAGYFPQRGDEYNRLQLAREQGSFGQFANAMNQAVVGEIVGGTLEGVGHLLDVRQYGNLIRGEEEEFSNALSEVGKSLREHTKTVSPIYVAPNAKQYNPADFAWWMNHFPSVASTLSLMIPSAGAVRGLGAIGKMMGGEALVGRMANLLRTTGRNVKWGLTGVSQAVISRHMENLMEAGGVYEEQLKLARSMHMNEDEARKFASVAASNTYKYQWMLLLQDIPQYLLLNKLGGMGERGTTMKVARAMGADPGLTLASKAGTVVRDMVGEAGEEAYQYLINEQSKLLSQKQIDPNVETSLYKVWQDHYDNGDMWTAATFGALGAGVMQLGFAGVNAKAIQSSNKARIEELQGRGRIFSEMYGNYKDALDSGDPLLQRQALSNLSASLAVNAVTVGNERNLIKDIEALTNDSSEATLERYGLSTEEHGMLKDNPDIATTITEDVKRATQLLDQFNRENEKNSKISKKNKYKYAQVMTINQMIMDKTKAEKEQLEQELNDQKGAAVELNKMTPTGRRIMELQQEMRTLSNPEGQIGSTDYTTKPGVIDVLNHRMQKYGSEMTDIEKAELEGDIAFAKLQYELLSSKLKEEKAQYSEEDQEADKQIAVTEEEIRPILSLQSRVKWAEASINNLSKTMDKYRKGDKLSKDRETDDTSEGDNVDPETGTKVGDVVVYTDGDGNMRKGRVTDMDIPKFDSEGRPIGREDDNTDNIYTIQPLKENGDVDGKPITKFGLEVTQDEESKIEQEDTDTSDATSTIDPLDQGQDAKLGVENVQLSLSNQGTESPISNLSYSHIDLSTKETVVRNEELANILSNPKTDYTGATAVLYLNREDMSYVSKIKTAIKNEIESITEEDVKKNPKLKEKKSNLRKLGQLLNKLLQKKNLTAEEAKSFISLANSLPMGHALDSFPISVRVTIDGKSHTKGLFLHGADFDYIKIPPKVYRALRTNPKAIEQHKATKKQEARQIRNTFLERILTGGSIETSGLSVGPGHSNNLPTSLPKEKRKRNIAEILGLAASKVRFGIAKSRPEDQGLAVVYTGENSRLGTRMEAGSGNLFAVTKKTVNGKQKLIKLNPSKIEIEHADILLDAFRVVTRAIQGKKSTAFKKHGNDSKIKVRKAMHAVEWAKKYDRVTGIKPGELIDLLVAHGRKLTDPRSAYFKGQVRNEEHNAVLRNKTLYMEATKNTAKVHYGYNEKTDSPFVIDFLDSNDVRAKREHFAKWMHEYKNYAAHINKSSIGLSLNGNFLEKRSFNFGERHPIVRDAKDGYNAFLINNNLYTTDVENTEHGISFKNPYLDLGLGNVKAGPVTQVKPSVSEADKPAKPPAPTVEDAPPQRKSKSVEELEEELERKLAKTPSETGKNKLRATYAYRIDKARTLGYLKKEESKPEVKEEVKPKEESKPKTNPLDDIDAFAMSAPTETMVVPHVFTDEQIEALNSFVMFEGRENIYCKGICNDTAHASTKFLESIGLKPYPSLTGSDLAVKVYSPVGPFMIIHYVSAVIINEQVYIYDMPQNEFISDSFFGMRTNIPLKSAYAPRLIPLTKDDIKANYNLTNEDAVKFIRDIIQNKGTNASPSFEEYIRDTMETGAEEYLNSIRNVIQEELGILDRHEEYKLESEKKDLEKELSIKKLKLQKQMTPITAKEESKVINFLRNKLKLKTKEYIPKTTQVLDIDKLLRNILGDTIPLNYSSGFSNISDLLSDLEKYLESKEFKNNLWYNYYTSLQELKESNEAISGIYSLARLFKEFLRRAEVDGIQETLSKYSKHDQSRIKRNLPANFTSVEDLIKKGKYKSKAHVFGMLRGRFTNVDQLLKEIGRRETFKQLQQSRFIAHSKAEKYNTLLNYLTVVDFNSDYIFESLSNELRRRAAYFVKIGQPVFANTSSNPLTELDSPFMEEMKSTLKKRFVRKADLEKEKTWIKERIGIDNVKEVDRLLRIAGTGRRAYALYSHDAILVYEGAVEGVLYHEAWHRVSLGYLTEKERLNLYKQARQIYKLDESMSNRDVEEHLAEEFRKYVLSQELKEKPKQHSFIRRIFQKIYDWIKSIFAGPNHLRENEVDAMFRSIYQGDYATSEILEENINNATLGDWAMATGRHKFQTITSSKHRKDVVKLFADRVLDLNGIHNLNSLRGEDRIKAAPFFEWLSNSIENLKEFKQDTPEKQERADKLRLLFTEVDKHKAVFWDMILDYFSTVGIESRNASLTLNDIEQLEGEEEVIGLIDVDSRSSWEVNLKDNAMASIKFLVSRLHSSTEVDLVTGIQPYVEFNQVWDSLLQNLNMLDNIEDMISELKALAAQYPDSPWFYELAKKLQDGDADQRAQFLTTFNVWKHSYLTFLFKNTSEGAVFSYQDNTETELARNQALGWNERLYLDKNIVDVDDNGNRVFNKDFFYDLNEDYQKLLEDVEAAIENNETDVDPFVKRLVELYNRLHIEIDSKTIYVALSEFYTEDDTDLSSIYTMLDSDGRLIFGKNSALYKEALVEKDELDEEEPLRVQSAFITNPVIYRGDSNSKGISKAYAIAHPELQENTVIGAEGNKYFTYAQHNLATDLMRKYKNDLDFLKERRTLLNNKHSRILKLLEENQEIRDAFYLMSFSSIKERNTDDKGRSYKSMVRLEDYLVRFNAIAEGHLPLPVMANRRQFFFMTGVPTLKNVVKGVKKTKKGIELSFSDEALDLFYGYYLDEKERVQEAHALRAEYQSSETSPERKEEIKKGLIKNYHYTGDLDMSDGNAYKFIHFKAFNKHKDPSVLDKFKESEVKALITNILNRSFENEYKHAASIGAITRTENNHLNFSALYSSEGLDLDAELNIADDSTRMTHAVSTVLGEFMVNGMMATMESEKIFFADPAFFARTKGTEADVSEDLYKRWFGVGSTGARFALETEDEPDSWFNVGTFNTQKFPSIHYDAIHARQVEIYKELGVEEEEAKRKATFNLKGLKNVDPTDGQMLVSPDMFRSMSRREGQWNKRKNDAFELLNSDKKLTPEEEMVATGIIFQPLKTVYIGKHKHNNLDLVIYDKMSMATIFRRQVKGTPLEEVLDRMELKGKYADKGLEPIHAFKYDTATKIGGRPGIDFFTDANKRDTVTDLSEAIIQKQLFDNLKHQVVTDVHDVERNKVGSQAHKILTSNIHKDQPYGEYKTGADLLEAVTSSREALSNIGKDRVKAKFGVKNGRIDNKRLLATLQSDAKQAKKSYDFIQALRTNKHGEMYLELDAFPDRKWVYDRIMSLIGKETVDMNLPGNQLIQVSDYGMSYNKDLQYSHPTKEGTTELEVRVSTRLFKHVIPNYDNISHEERVEFLKAEFKLIGYRVPVQGQNSTVRLKVVDFLREQSGDIIQLPLEFTALTGSDFDIDKLFIISYNYDKSAKLEGKVEKVEYISGNTASDIDVRYMRKFNELVEIYSNNENIIGTDTYNMIQSHRRNIKEDVTNRSTLNIDLIAAREKERAIFEQLKSGGTQELIDEHLKVVTHISELEDRIGLTHLNFVDIATKSDIEIAMKALINNNVLPTKEAFSEWSISDQNTREANENKILDIYHTVLGDAKHFLETSTPLDTYTNPLKEKAAKYDKLYGVNKELNSLETLTPSYQSKTRETFIGADQGIGKFALSNAHHALTQHAGFGIKSEIDFGLNEESEKVIWFDKINGQDEKPITNWLSALIDAHVDAAKDPYIIRLNVNDSTINVINLMIRAGVGEVTLDFITQPILKEYAEEVFNASGAIKSEEAKEAGDDAEKYAYNKVLQRWADKIGIEADDISGTDIQLATLLDEKHLASNIEKYLTHRELKKAEKEKYVSEQIAILQHFKEIEKVAEDLQRVVMASRIDTKKYGSTPVEMRKFLNQIYNLEDSDNFVNLDKLVRSDGVRVEGGTMLSTLLKNSVLFGLDLMSDKSIYGSLGFNTIFGRILELVPKGMMADTITMNNIMEELFAMLSSEFFVDKEEGLGIDKAYLENLLKNPETSIFNQLQKIKRESHEAFEEVKDNAFVNMMIVDYNERFPGTEEDNMGWFIRVPYRTLNDRWETDDYIDDFEALISSKNDSIKELSLMLYVYSFYTTGWRQRRHSFNTYMPSAMNKEIKIGDKYVSFNKFIKKLRRQMADQNQAVAGINTTLRQFFRNNWWNNNIVASIPESLTEDIEINGVLAGMEVDLELNKKYYRGRNKEGLHIFSPYIRVEDDEGVHLMEYAGYNKKTLKPVYRIVPRKGFLEGGIGLREYGFKTEQSIINAFNKGINEDAFFKEMNNKEDFQGVLFNQQEVTDKSRFDNAYYKKFGTEKQIGELPVEKMVFEDGTGGRKMKAEFAGKSTMDLIKSGDRTATSRNYISPYKEGDHVIFEGKNGERVEVEITKEPYKVSEITPEEWSKLEGWDESVYDPNKYQYQFKVVPWTGGISKVESIPTTKVISGAQSGVDRIALEAARVANLETGGIAPKGFGTEYGGDLTVTSFGVRELTPEEEAQYGTGEYPGLTARTTLNVLNADATLYFQVKGADKKGYWATKRAAENAGKEFIEVNEDVNPNAIRQWLVEENIKTLNIAGNRGSRMTTSQAMKIKSAIVEILTGKPYQIVMSDALSTPDMPIKIYTDGSDKPNQNQVGYGAFFTWQGTDYELSGTNWDVNRLIKDEAFKQSKNKAYVMELLAMQEALRKFRNTYEHLHILVDNENAINYEGIWDHTVVNRYRSEAKKGEKGKRTKATVPNTTGSAPWLVPIIEDINKSIKQIEENGGSVKFQWIPGHITRDKAEEYPHVFVDESGAVDNTLIDEYTAGNNRADILAQATVRKNAFKTLGAPQIESIEEIREQAEDNISEHTQDNLPLC